MLFRSGVSNAATGRTDSFGREQSTVQAASSAFGIKLGSYPQDVLLQNAKRATQAKLDEAGLDVVEYDSRGGRYRIRIGKSDLPKHEGIVTELLKLAYVGASE